MAGTLVGALALTVGGGYVREVGRPQRDPYYPGDGDPAPTSVVADPPSTGTSAVARENARAGTAGFTVTKRRFGRDRHGQIAGYADLTGVEVGGDLNFHVSVTPAQRYRIQVYRMGHYGGVGGRLVAASPWLAGRSQGPPVLVQKTRMVRCD